MWFGVKNIYKSLDSGEDSKIAKFFLPKDYMRNLEMIEKRAQRLQREEQENKLREENSSEENEEDKEVVAEDILKEE